MTASTYTCGLPGCSALAGREFCARHWRQLPRAAQEDIEKAWRKYCARDWDNEARATSAAFCVYARAVLAARRYLIRLRAVREVAA